MGFYKMGATGRPVAADPKSYEGYKEESDHKAKVRQMAQLLADRGEVEQVFTCSFCKRQFSGEHALKTHVGKAHPSERARQDHLAAVKQRQKENFEREVQTEVRHIEATAEEEEVSEDVNNG